MILPRAMGAFITILSLFLTMTSARLYPTNPSTNAVLMAGQTAQVAWMDDIHRPSITEMGPVQIDMYSSDSVSSLLQCGYANGE